MSAYASTKKLRDVYVELERNKGSRGFGNAIQKVFGLES